MRHTAIFMAASVLVLVALLTLDLVLGSVRIPMRDVLQSLLGYTDNTLAQSIVSNYRLPKAITAILAGAALSVSGLLMQTIFRNPLAGPYVLGISSGASLGVALVVLGSSALGLGFWVGQLGVVLAAMMGAMLVLLLILAVSMRIRDIMTILILGMMFGSAASAITSILQFFSDESSLKSYVLWTMGSVSGVSGDRLTLFAIIIAVGTVLALLLARPLNVLNLGENYAKTLGYNVISIRFLAFLSTSLLAGAAAAFCGPIGFIGLAVPHIVKISLRTSNHTALLPATLITGGNMLLLCDLLAQLPGSDLVFPINSMAALMGIPVVIYVIFKNKRIAA
ncbi:MAG: iron ABC transporter permease [Bacteroidales bacterium]|nr:iron ABC transporter permease [Bacteroidales bacterium]